MLLISDRGGDWTGDSDQYQRQDAATDDRSSNSIQGQGQLTAAVSEGRDSSRDSRQRRAS